MVDLLAPLAPLAPYAPVLNTVLAITALAVLVGVALAVWRLLRRIYPEAGPEAGPAAGPRTAEKAPSLPAESTAPSISEEFARGMALLRRAGGGGRKWRYSTPIVVCLGEAGAGQGTLLGSLDLNRPFGTAATAGGGPGTGLHSDCAWHLFDQGVALDLAGKLVLRADGGAGEDAGWREFVRQLQRYRPERGLDGIVLTIPGTDLTGQDRPSPERLLAKGEAVYRRLWDLQQQTGLRLPVYVVVTKCDLVPGFQGFWGHAAARHGRELFGWSNANNLESAYGAHLIDEAFAELDTELRRTWIAEAVDQDEPEDPDGMFLFPGEFQRLAEPLKLYLDRLFRPTAYHEAFFFRGLYFVGDCERPVQPSALRALVPADADVAVRTAAGEAPRRPLFGTDLFAEKVFAERRLARAASVGLVSRNRTVLAAQVGLVLLAFVLAAGAWISTNRLIGTLGDLHPALELIADAQANANATAEPGELEAREAERLLAYFSDIDRRTLRFAFLPSSWVSGLEDRVIDRFAHGLDRIVLAPMRAKLDERADLMIDAFEQPVPAGSREYLFTAGPEFGRMRQFAERMDELETNARALEGIRGRDLSEVARLAGYLFDARLTFDFVADSDLYETALHRTDRFSFGRERHAAHAREAMKALDARLQNKLAPDGPVAAGVRALASAIDEVERVQSQRGDASVPLARLIDALVTVGVMLEDPDFHWILRRRPADDPYYRAFLKTVRQSPYFGPDLADDLARRTGESIEALRSTVLDMRARLTGPVLLVGEDGEKLRLQDGLDALALGLAPVFRHAFMQERPERRPVAQAGRGVILVWNAKALGAAVELHRSFEAFLAADLAGVPQAFRPVVERLARERLRSALMTAVADAQVRERQPPDLYDGAIEAALTRNLRAFRLAAPNLVTLLGILRQLGFDDDYVRLRDIAGRHAHDLLQMVDALAESDQAYVAAGAFRGWDGTGRLSAAGFLAPDDVALARYLETVRGRLSHLSEEMAMPLLDFLLHEALGTGWRASPAVMKWRRISTELQRREANSPTSTVAVVEHFIRTELDTITIETCFDQLADAEQASSGDFFLNRRNVLRRQVLDQCRHLAGVAAQDGYDRLVADFNASLAGRYPFAEWPPGTDPSGADLPEADPADVADFFVRFASIEPAVRQGLERGARVDPAARSALAFVERIGAARDFLAPLLAVPTDEAGPAFDVEVDFRVNRPRETGGNQIIGWSVDIAGQALERGREPVAAKWRPGDPVEIALRWARNAPMVPLPPGGNTGAELEGRTVVYRYANQWSLVRALQAHRALPSDFERLEDPQPHTLLFAVPVGPAADAGTSMPAAGDGVRAFIRIAVSSMGPDGEERRRHVLPAFPTRAPAADIMMVY